MFVNISIRQIFYYLYNNKMMIIIIINILPFTNKNLVR